MRVFCKNAKIFVIVTHNAEMKQKNTSECQINVKLLKNTLFTLQITEKHVH